MSTALVNFNAVVPQMDASPDPRNETSSRSVVSEGSPARDVERKVNLLVLCGLALFVGVMTGFGAVALRALIGFFHNASLQRYIQYLVRR